MSRPRLNTQLSKQIIAGVRSGGYPHVAAEAWGVSKEQLDEWIGRGSTGRGRWAEFVRELRQACGQARLRAELEVFQSAPKLWLEHGPGRESANNPGWTAAVHAAESAAEASNALLDRELMAMFQKLLDLLTPHPELRARAAEIFPLTPPRAA